MFLKFSLNYRIFCVLWEITAIASESIDKRVDKMIKYRGKKPALIGKSSLFHPSESLGHWLEARVGIGKGKCVRERVSAYKR